MGQNESFKWTLSSLIRQSEAPNTENKLDQLPEWTETKTATRRNEPPGNK